ncbi:S4 domain-containing protein [Algiphilus sp. W345]|uniref:Heat shock protein 15 n=1 Tax=Banduia mediterranea TaxID=3075609 RepID=A0ABU2WK49_9GAMM|nr:S4 domain-containing protein [Algiphilus sp. W345]MDT0498245.1 S4 domain-containing protein [Algiphilus sp. W345]
MSQGSVEPVRLDKWLWAARFFRTRSLAKQAVENGKVLYNGERPKVSRVVQIGASLRVAQGDDRVEIRVLGLSDRRGGAPEARLLYEETAQSVEQRAVAAAQRRANVPVSTERPSKKERRLISRFKRGS